MLPESPTTITSLPFEVLLQIFTMLTPYEILNILSTSHYYRGFFLHESIWRELCSRHGVLDLASFSLHNRTFYTVYTELLHTYGHLLGLWANDSPFRGRILEFRLVNANEAGWEGIVGEVWKFPTGHPTEVRNEEMFSGVLYTNAIDEFMQLNAPHRQGFQLCQLHPDSVAAFGMLAAFPPLDPQSSLVPSMENISIFDCGDTPGVHLCHDRDRPLPCLKIRHSDALDHEHLLEKLTWLKGYQIMYMSPQPQSTRPFPPSLTIYTHEYSRAFLGHFFPLPPPFIPSNNTHPDSTSSESAFSSPRWKPQDLQGLWLAPYDADGTEVLSLVWDETAGELQGWKVTGDYNVPRGAMSWNLKLVARETFPVDNVDGWVLERLLITEELRSVSQVYTGEGYVAGPGHT
ncbi:hypothetical protein BXZ70DRAFT_894630 [Cristinia sonorae]|uniref:F-box domain-containing protein n=1 Tax=Cristinia sonorae TaxID=1940300 RepID=A0A8K0ULL6_9AGAR|nr:hypothetical protein BXZ70DRAFT_894630 [Cristinia sonorae]